MALSKALTEARRQTATRANRDRQARAEARLDEIVKVAGIADEYDRADRAGDIRVETAFARIYQAAHDEKMRHLVVDAYVAWQSDEKAEEAIVHGETEQAVSLLKRHNPLFIEDIEPTIPAALLARQKAVRA